MAHIVRIWSPQKRFISSFAGKKIDNGEPILVLTKTQREGYTPLILSYGGQAYREFTESENHVAYFLVNAESLLIGGANRIGIPEDFTKQRTIIKDNANILIRQTRTDSRDVRQEMKRVRSLLGKLTCPSVTVIGERISEPLSTPKSYESFNSNK